MVHTGLTAFATFGTQRWMEVDHNTFHGSVRGVAFAFSTFQNFFFRNNIIASEGHTVQFLSSTATSLTATFNLLHRTTAGPIAYWNADRNTLANLQTASGNFANSLVADPLFYVPLSDLHVYAMEADAAGTPIAAVTIDIDGDVRSLATPDIGADEFQPVLWNEAFNTCGAADAITSTGSGNAQWIYKDRKVVARFNDNGQNLGTVSMSVYVNSAAVRQSIIGQHYLDRNWHLQTQNAIVGAVNVRLFHSGNEFTTYATADPVVSVYADAGVAHYVGPMEDCNLPNNPAGNIWTPIFPASPAMEPRIQGNGGTHGYTAALGNDGELYITNMGLPLPVELLSLTGERTTDSEVMLTWSTATEHNNAGFEVWRMIEGETEFTEVGWLDGAGDSQSLITYELQDENTAIKTSYYKLKQVDNDGQSAWSDVVAVAGANGQEEFLIYPNPASGEFFIQGDRGAMESVQLLDADGREVARWGPDVRFDLQRVPAGTYAVRVMHMEGGFVQRRLVVQ
ncbi:MAG: T9SS type A sorting domain-containing protein [Flavobacteriales bacterium]|nr:T9SS type A sorting domain-containing protein [Flavobacteriales bacterium]